MKNVSLFLFAGALLFVGAGCAPTTPDTTPTVYDQNSWKDIIPASCVSFNDGCNACRRSSADPSIAACTKKFCETYTKPVCLD